MQSSVCRSYKSTKEITETSCWVEVMTVLTGYSTTSFHGCKNSLFQCLEGIEGYTAAPHWFKIKLMENWWYLYKLLKGSSMDRYTWNSIHSRLQKQQWSRPVIRVVWWVLTDAGPRPEQPNCWWKPVPLSWDKVSNSLLKAMWLWRRAILLYCALCGLYSQPASSAAANWVISSFPASKKPKKLSFLPPKRA